MLYDREQENEELNFVLHEPGSHFLMVSSRRRLGKTMLLVEWARQTERPTINWVAIRVSSTQSLRSFSQAVFAHLHPDASIDPGFSYPSWEMAFGS